MDRKYKKEDPRSEKIDITRSIGGLTMIIIIGGIMVCAIFMFSKNSYSISRIITISSAVIALFALLYTYLTYSSIDSVNKLSRMDGNVLENENYITEFSVLVLRYRETTNAEILKHVKYTFKKLLSSKHISGAKMSDNLQEIVDVLRPMAFMLNNLDKNDEEKIKGQLSRTIQKIESRIDSFNEMSDGSTKLMRETVKLIKGIFFYQRYRSEEKRNKSVELLKVNQSILKNKASRSLYYNYRGLIFYNGAMDKIRDTLYPNVKTVKGLFKISILKEMPSKVNPSNMESYDMVMMSLEEAINYHQKALELIGDDPLGNAYIQYDLARALYFYNLFKGLKTTEWISAMNKAVFYRARLYMTAQELIKSKELEDYENLSKKKRRNNEQPIIQDDSTYMIRGYLFQWIKAKEMKALLEISLGLPVTDNYGSIISGAGVYGEEVLKYISHDDVPGFKNDRKFKKDIEEYISNSQK